MAKQKKQVQKDYSSYPKRFNMRVDRSFWQNLDECRPKIQNYYSIPSNSEVITKALEYFKTKK